uniref:F-box domain-containing protein n=1 Tax=Globodera pallida TaxID=36090 RepID=A0A183BWX3_GLOPA
MSYNANEKEQQQQMEEIFICDDVWYEVFAFIDPFELGLKMALISDRLDVLVDVHFSSRKWSLGSMEIRRAFGGNGAEIVSERSGGQPLPIPQGPLPDKVIGFKCIEINYIDQTFLEFLQRISPLFDSSGSNVAIFTEEDQSRSWEIIWQIIWPLVNDKICRFLLDFFELDYFRQFSPAMLRNCANLRSMYSGWLFPEFPAEDNAEASSRQALAEWLLTPRGDGLPKMLYCDLNWDGTEGLTDSFVNASESANFIIITWNADDVFVPFELKNNLTEERLTFRHFTEDKWLLVRCPIGREEDKWTNWEKEAIELDLDNQWNRIFIDLKDSDIGDGMDAANEGPSEPKKPKNGI